MITIFGRVKRRGYEVRCCKCFNTAAAGLSRKAAQGHARRQHFRLIEASDRPRAGDGYWLCPECYQEWDVRLTIQQYLRSKHAAI